MQSQLLKGRGPAVRALLAAVRVPKPAAVAVSLRRPCKVASGDGATAAAPAQLPVQAIMLTDAALAHLKKLRAEVGGDELLLRVGVKQGGCSGMSYVMDFEAPDKVGADDTVMNAGEGAEAAGLRLVCDPKSLLYLFGMQLDYSPALIGGGLKFQNPNATETCGCGTSFTV